MQNSDQDKENANVPQVLSNIGTGLEAVNLEGLTETQVQELKMLAAKNNIDVMGRAKELGLDAHALGASLNSMTNAAADATETNTSFTATQTRDDHLGRTEIVVGNTETAAQGKLSRSQSGQQDRTLLFVLAGVVCVIVIGLLAANLSK